MSHVNERYKDVNENIESNHRSLHPKACFQVGLTRSLNKQQLENPFQSRSPIRINNIQGDDNVSNETEPDSCPGMYRCQIYLC